MTAHGHQMLNLCRSHVFDFPEAFYTRSPPSKAAVLPSRGKKPEILGGVARSSFVAPIKAMEASEAAKHANGQPKLSLRDSAGDIFTENCFGFSGKNTLKMSTVGNSSNIVWHKSSVEKSDREELLNQKGCVIWITGLSGSGKSTLACALSRALHARGKLTYILDGDNCRHGLNRDLSFKAEDRSENIRRIGEVAKLFADAGVICIASLISPFRKERDACRALLPEGGFIEVMSSALALLIPLFSCTGRVNKQSSENKSQIYCQRRKNQLEVSIMQVYLDVPLQVCEIRDPKGLYKLARAGKIKGFTGIDDPYEPPLNSEIVLHQEEGNCDSPAALAEKLISYLERKGYLEA